MLIKSKPSRRKPRIVALKNKQDTNKVVIDRQRNHLRKNDPLSNNLKDNDKVLSSSFDEPFWLKGLFLLQKGSSIFCFIMISGMLLVYGMTVYAPQMWTKDFQKLNALRKDERQMTSQNEVIIDQLVKQADQKGIDLVNPNPSNQPIFLPETTPKPLLLNGVAQSEIKPPAVLSPLAY